MCDLEIQILHGYKLKLSVAFEYKLLDPEILSSDDYQEISFEEHRDEIIEKWVISDNLIEILKDKKWNIYILTSSQEDSDPDTSYFFLFNKKQELCSGQVNDYETGPVEIWIDENDQLPPLIKKEEWNFDIHWIIESSF